VIASMFTMQWLSSIRYDTIEEFNVDSKAEYLALSSTRVANTPAISWFNVGHGYVKWMSKVAWRTVAQ